MTIGEDMQQAILRIPAGMLGLASWPAGMRVIVRKERPHPGALLRFTDLTLVTSPR